jgi:hypothetical protein
MAATTVATSKTIASGNETFDAVDQSSKDFLTLAVKYADIDQDVKIKVLQSIDDSEYGDISFPGSRELHLNIKGSGVKFLNLIGLYCSKIKIEVEIGKATSGTINSIKVWNA